MNGFLVAVSLIVILVPIVYFSTKVAELFEVTYEA